VTDDRAGAPKAAGGAGADGAKAAFGPARAEGAEAGEGASGAKGAAPRGGSGAEARREGAGAPAGRTTRGTGTAAGAAAARAEGAADEASPNAKASGITGGSGDAAGARRDTRQGGAGGAAAAAGAGAVDTPTTKITAVSAGKAGKARKTPGAAGAAAAAGAAGADSRGTVPGATAANASGPAAGAPGTTATIATASAAAAASPAAGPGADASSDKGNGKGKRPKRRGLRRLVPTWRMVLGGVITLAVLLIGAFFLGYSLVKIPAANALAMKQANVYLYADGSEIAREGEINRENVSLAQVSKDAQHAVLAAEDRDFYTESAVDPVAMVRAGWNTVTGKGKQSGSTITQQYVKNYYLGQEQTVTRKVKEFFIAIKLDRSKSKDDILEGYLNTSFFGRNAYGIQAAARAYYGMDAKDLDPARAAYLAALVNAPSEYDVVAHPENKDAAVARWNYVLDGMVKKGWLSASERAGMTFPMPKQATVPVGLAGQRGYIVRAVKDYLDRNHILSEQELATGGYRITTTLQKNKQDAFVKAVDDQLMNKLDKENNKVDRYVRAGGAAIDPKTGEVVAMYGGIDYVQQYTNNATRRDFQVGSTFKPFVLASAVENGSRTQDGRPITPNTAYDGTNKRPVRGWTGYYAPENEDQHSYGNITVREATDKSVNAVYAQMAVDVGSSKVKDTAIALGLPKDTPELSAYPSIALGVARASVLDMAQAYATLANHGRHGTYTIVKKITKGGEAVNLPKQATTQAISREAADTTTAVLQSVVQNGTATAAKAAGRPAAGKTGTAEEDTAAWFAGYTPDLATVVSVMGQDPDTAAHKSLYGAMGLPRINGGGAPAEIWAQFTRDALKGTPAHDFDLRMQAGADRMQPVPGDSSAQTPGGDEPGTGTPGGDTPGGSTTPGQEGQVQGQGQGDAGQTGGTPGSGTAETAGDTAGSGTPPTGGADTGGGPATGGSTSTTGGADTGGGPGTGGGMPATGGTDAGGAAGPGGPGAGPGLVGQP
jgi:membrane peptidoglycan carboxypeptidase